VLCIVSLTACTGNGLFDKWVPPTSTVPVSAIAANPTYSAAASDVQPTSEEVALRETIQATSIFTITPENTITSFTTTTIPQSETEIAQVDSTGTVEPILTVTRTPTPPFAYLQIKKPGKDSFVVSPINMEVMINPGDDGLLRIDLLGEDGRIIAHEELDYSYAIGNRFWTSPKLSYSIDSVAELGRLELSVYDEHSRIIALSTVDLYLQSLGRYDIKDAVSLKEPFVIRYPYHKAEIEDGIVYVNGLAQPINDNPLIFELVDENRTVIGTWELNISQPQSGQSHTPFSVQVPYIINATTPVRLTIRQESDSKIPGNVAINSVEILLQP